MSSSIMNISSEDITEYKKYFRETNVGAKGGDGGSSNSKGTISKPASQVYMETNAEKAARQSAIDDINSAVSTSLDKFAVLNMPHQYLMNTDPVAFVDGSVYSDAVSDDDAKWMGRCYQKFIGSLGPFCVFKIGKPKYNGVFGQVTNDVISEMMEMDDESKSSFLDTLFEGSKENEMYYYTFQNAFEEYAKYVNTLVVYTATRMGIKEVWGRDITDFNAGSYIKQNNSKGVLGRLLGEMLNTLDFITIYLDSAGTTFSENSGNSTTESQLASGLKTLGQSKRELDFLMGKSTSADENSSSANAKNVVTQLYSTLSDTVDKLTNKLSGSFSSISMGANVIFPSIWSESEYGFSYNLKIRLESPYGDPERILQNVYIPFFYLMAMSLPRQAGKQGYVGPFLVQACAKSWFGCYCGIVSSFTATKAPNSEWTVDGYPSVIEVNMELKDMYPTMVGISKGIGYGFRQNYTLVSYLNIMAGVEVNDFEPSKNLEADVNLLWSQFKKIPYNIERKVTSELGRPARALINKVFGGYN